MSSGNLFESRFLFCFYCWYIRWLQGILFASSSFSVKCDNIFILGFNCCQFEVCKGGSSSWEEKKNLEEINKTIVFKNGD